MTTINVGFPRTIIQHIEYICCICEKPIMKNEEMEVSAGFALIGNWYHKNCGEAYRKCKKCGKPTKKKDMIVQYCPAFEWWCEDCSDKNDWMDGGG